MLCDQQSCVINLLLTDIFVAKLLKHVHEGLGANKFGICDFIDLRKKNRYGKSGYSHMV